VLLKQVLLKKKSVRHDLQAVEEVQARQGDMQFRHDPELLK